MHDDLDVQYAITHQPSSPVGLTRPVDWGRAIEHYEQALAIARKIGYRQGESARLGNLGSCYLRLGEVRRAIEHHEQALAIAREIGDRKSEAHDLGNCYADRGEWEQAVARYEEAIRIGDELAHAQLQSEVRCDLAEARLLTGDLSAARRTAEAAARYDWPTDKARLLVVLGVVLLRHREDKAARRALTEAIAAADAVLEHTADHYNVLDSKALALCGLALLAETDDRLSEAIAVFRAARAITGAAGTVRRVLRLFDTIAIADCAGTLTAIRAAAAGEDN